MPWPLYLVSARYPSKENGLQKVKQKGSTCVTLLIHFHSNLAIIFFEKFMESEVHDIDVPLILTYIYQVNDNFRWLRILCLVH